MLYYLDQNIDIKVSYTAPASDTLYTYRVQRRENDVTWTNLFVGNFFAAKGTTSHTFHLNAIIEDNKPLQGLELKEDEQGEYYLGNDGNFGVYRVIVNNGTTDTYSALFNVLMVYRYPNVGKVINPQINVGTDNYIEYDTNFIQGVGKFFYPHIPAVSSNNFIFGVFIYSAGEYYQYNLMNVCDDGGQTGSLKINTAENTWGHINLPLSEWYKGFDLRVEDQTLLELYSASDPIYELARMDLCPAKYYLCWQDRYGSMQSQPFTGTETYSETTEQKISTNYRNEKSLVGVNVTPKWKIQTGWIKEDLYPYYESIFCSPYLKLYMSDSDTFIDVLLTDSDYAEKTYFNQGRKLFNLELNIEKSKIQNIVY